MAQIASSNQYQQDDEQKSHNYSCCHNYQGFNAHQVRKLELAPPRYTDFHQSLQVLEQQQMRHSARSSPSALLKPDDDYVDKDYVKKFQEQYFR